MCVFCGCEGPELNPCEIKGLTLVMLRESRQQWCGQQGANQKPRWGRRKVQPPHPPPSILSKTSAPLFGTAGLENNVYLCGQLCGAARSWGRWEHAACQNSETRSKASNPKPPPPKNTHTRSQTFLQPCSPLSVMWLTEKTNHSSCSSLTLRPYSVKSNFWPISPPTLPVAYYNLSDCLHR